MVEIKSPEYLHDVEVIAARKAAKLRAIEARSWAAEQAAKAEPSPPAMQMAQAVQSVQAAASLQAIVHHEILQPAASIVEERMPAVNESQSLQPALSGVDEHMSAVINTQSSQPAAPCVVDELMSVVNNTHSNALDSPSERSFKNKRSATCSESDSAIVSEYTSMVESSSHGPTSPTTTGMVPVSASSSLPRTSKKLKVDEAETSTAVTETGLPSWYIAAKTKGSKMRSEDRQKEVRLGLIKKLINECKEVRNNPKALEEAFDKVREELHFLEFLKVNASLIAKKKLLDNDKGLPQIFKPEFSGGVTYPSYIQDDGRYLYTRWYNSEFEQDLFKGILNMVNAKDTTVKGKGKGRAIDGQKKEDWKYFGNHGLINGQWWGSLLCALRDGAHGSAQSGIAGIKGEGATSILLSGDTYQKYNRDDGEELRYSGTMNQEESSSAEPTEGTQKLMDSFINRKPVRVIRSANLPASNQFRPVKGFRFDGLYKVVGQKLENERRQHYVFHLRRIEGQAPIRYKDVEARPTKQQIQEFDLEMTRYGRKGARVG